MKMVYQYIVIFFPFSRTSNHLHPLQVENCDSTSRLIVDEDDTGKFRIQRVNLARVLGLIPEQIHNKLTISGLRKLSPTTY